MANPESKTWTMMTTPLSFSEFEEGIRVENVFVEEKLDNAYPVLLKKYFLSLFRSSLL
jgi:hypothetical protein